MRQTFVRYLLNSVLVVCTLGIADSGRTATIPAGTQEGTISFSFNGVAVGEESSWQSQLGLTLGYFTDWNTEFGFSGYLVSQPDVDAVGRVTAFSALHFVGDELRRAPFVGVEAGRGFSPENGSWVYGVFAGAKLLTGCDGYNGGAIVVQGYLRRIHFDSITVSEYGLQIGLSLIRKR